MRIIVLLTVCLFLTDAPTYAVAATRFVSGDSCQEAYGDEGADIFRNSYGTQSSNASTYRWIWCPLMGISNPASLDISSAEVFYYDGTSTTQVKCELWARTETGTGYVTGFKYSQPDHSPQWTTTQNANLADIGYGSLSWTNPLNGGSAIGNVATISFKCAINETDKLMGFYVVE